MSQGMDLLTLQNFSTILHNGDQSDSHMNEDEFKAFQILQDSAKNYDIKGLHFLNGL